MPVKPVRTREHTKDKKSVKTRRKSNGKHSSIARRRDHSHSDKSSVDIKKSSSSSLTLLEESPSTLRANLWRTIQQNLPENYSIPDKDVLQMVSPTNSEQQDQNTTRHDSSIKEESHRVPLTSSPGTDDRPVATFKDKRQKLKGIILAGGTGTRLYPLTKTMNKHLLPVGKYPMIFHGIHKLRQAGLRDILIIAGRNDMGSLIKALGCGDDFGVAFTYKVQEHAGGIAQALALAEDFVGDDSMVVLLGDNIFADNLSPYIDKFKQQQQGAKVLLTKVKDPTRYGIAELNEQRVIRIEEKPKTPKSSYAVTGIYMYDHQVFDIVRKVTPSKRGELEITDVNNAYIEKGQLTFDILQGWWVDAGTHDSLLMANQFVREAEE